MSTMSAIERVHARAAEREAYALNFRLDCNQAGGLTKLHICANALNAVFSNGQSRLQSIRNGS
jgi:hypothetical protein